MFFCRCTLHSRLGSGRIQEAEKGRLENDFACSSWYLLKVNEAYSDTIIFLKKALPLQVNFDQFRMTILPTNIFFCLALVVCYSVFLCNFKISVRGQNKISRG